MAHFGRTDAMKRTGGGVERVHRSNVGAAHTVDLADGNVHLLDLTEDCTITLAGATPGVTCSVLLRLYHGSASRLVTWPDSVRWPGGTAPTLSSTSWALDMVSLTTTSGGTDWVGLLLGLRYQGWVS